MPKASCGLHGRCVGCGRSWQLSHWLLEGEVAVLSWEGGTLDVEEAT